jgi:hypothetical protein
VTINNRSLPSINNNLTPILPHPYTPYPYLSLPLPYTVLHNNDNNTYPKINCNPSSYQFGHIHINEGARQIVSSPYNYNINNKSTFQSTLDITTKEFINSYYCYIISRKAILNNSVQYTSGPSSIIIFICVYVKNNCIYMSAQALPRNTAIATTYFDITWYMYSS